MGATDGKKNMSGLVALVAAAVMLSGCADSLTGLLSPPSLPKLTDLNPFAKKKEPLPGRRIPVLQTQQETGLPGELASADAPIALPPPRANQDWSQPGGEANNAPGHLALSGALNKAWTASVGTGGSSKGRITSPPIVYGGKVFALDAAGRVSAFSLSGGSAVWRASLIPEKEAGASGFMELSSSAVGGYGGGLAADGGRIYAASGFGRVVALDPANGKKLWEKELGTPVRAAPTASGDRVFVITVEGRFYCLSGLDGTELWVARGLPQQASLLINVSPAVENDVVVVPYPSGDLIAVNLLDGRPIWSENLARSRATSQLASLSDAARPAIDQGTVYAIGHAGRMIATQSKTGERLWSLNVPGTQTPWVAGDSVFVVDTSAQLMAVSRTDGKIRWTAKLPGGKTWSGPTLAGGKLWLASETGRIVGVDAVTGRVAVQQSLGGKFYIAPVVAQGRMFVLNDSATLTALN